MREYPKTDNLYKRNPKKKSELLIGQFTRPEYGLINSWYVSEKVDGTNVRLTFDKVGDYEYQGRTDNAQFTIGQENFLDDLCFNIGAAVRESIAHFNLDFMTLYGELYGPRIQAGGNYSDNLGFRMFDILVNGKTWLGPSAVEANAKAFGVDLVPSFGIMTTEQIFSLVSGGFVSTFSQNREYAAEGIVAVTPVPMYDQRGERIKFKLKTKDLK